MRSSRAGQTLHSASDVRERKKGPIAFSVREPVKLLVRSRLEVIFISMLNYTMKVPRITDLGKILPAFYGIFSADAYDCSLN